MYFRTVRCPLRATGAFRGQGRVVPRGAPGPVGSEGSRDVRNETGKTVPRCFVKLVSDLSEADRSEIQLDVLDLAQACVCIPGGKARALGTNGRRRGRRHGKGSSVRTPREREWLVGFL